jgi:membrane-associated phospholipid phosphatase
MPHKRLLRVLAAAATLSYVGLARPLRVAADPAIDSTGQQAPGKRRVAWSPAWRKFRAWEYGVSAAAVAGAFVIHYYDAPPSAPLWFGNNAFDDQLRSWLRLDTRAARTRANSVSNVLWLGGGAVPFVIDLPIVLLVHHQPGLTGQLLLMDLEATAVSQLLSNLLLFETGRARPSYQSCAADPSYNNLCGTPANNISFPSGHVMTIATAAGLTCVHHHYLPLYDSGVADVGACAFMSVATVATGVTRMMADHHRATDVLVATGLGFSIGYGMPWLLHYRASGGDGAAEASRPHAMLVPFGARGTLGLGLVGLL